MSFRAACLLPLLAGDAPAPHSEPRGCPRGTVPVVEIRNGEVWVLSCARYDDLASSGGTIGTDAPRRADA